MDIYKKGSKSKFVQAMLEAYLGKGIHKLSEILDTPASRINLAKIREMGFKEPDQIETLLSEAKEVARDERPVALVPRDLEFLTSLGIVGPFDLPRAVLLQVRAKAKFDQQVRYLSSGDVLAFFHDKSPDLTQQANWWQGDIRSRSFGRRRCSAHSRGVAKALSITRDAGGAPSSCRCRCPCGCGPSLKLAK